MKHGSPDSQGLIKLFVFYVYVWFDVGRLTGNWSWNLKHINRSNSLDTNLYQNHIPATKHSIWNEAVTEHVHPRKLTWKGKTAIWKNVSPLNDILKMVDLFHVFEVYMFITVMFHEHCCSGEQAETKNKLWTRVYFANGWLNHRLEFH